MKVGFIFLTVLLSLSFSVRAHSQIEIFGLNWGMESLKESTEDLGYTCGGYDSYNGTECTKGDRQINILEDTTVFEDQIQFSCEVFNGCGYSLGELAQAIVDQGIVRSVEYNYEGGASNRQTFCGRGDKGDLLCVISYESLVGGGTKVLITLFKGNYGQGGLTFN